MPAQARSRRARGFARARTRSTRPDGATVPLFERGWGYPFPATTTPAYPGVGFPMQMNLEAPDKVARWRPLVHWLLAIPQLIVLYALGIVQYIIWILSFFAILFTGRMPDSFFGFMAMTHRYQWRGGTYYLFMREP